VAFSIEKAISLLLHTPYTYSLREWLYSYSPPCCSLRFWRIGMIGERGRRVDAVLGLKTQDLQDHEV